MQPAGNNIINTSCATNTIWDDVTRSCILDTTLVCDVNTKWDAVLKKCVVDVQHTSFCGPNTVWDGSTHKCIPGVTGSNSVAVIQACDTGTHLSDGKCVPDIQACDTGTTLINEQCVADIQSCANGTHLNTDLKTCFPDIYICGAGTVLSEGRCIPDLQNCGIGTTLDLTTGKCRPNCGTGTSYDDGECAPDIRICGDKTTLQEDTCIVDDSTVCGLHTKWDESLQTCVLDTIKSKDVLLRPRINRYTRHDHTCDLGQSTYIFQPISNTDIAECKRLCNNDKECTNIVINPSDTVYEGMFHVCKDSFTSKTVSNSKQCKIECDNDPTCNYYMSMHMHTTTNNCRLYQTCNQPEPLRPYQPVMQKKLSGGTSTCTLTRDCVNPTTSTSDNYTLKRTMTEDDPKDCIPKATTLSGLGSSTASYFTIVEDDKDDNHYGPLNIQEYNDDACTQPEGNVIPFSKAAFVMGGWDMYGKHFAKVS